MHRVGVLHTRVHENKISPIMKQISGGMKIRHRGAEGNAGSIESLDPFIFILFKAHYSNGFLHWGLSLHLQPLSPIPSKIF